MGCLVQRSRGQRVPWVVDAGEFQFSMGRKQVKTNCTKRPCFVRTDGHHSNVPEAPVGSTTITPIDPSSPDRPTDCSGQVNSPDEPNSCIHLSANHYSLNNHLFFSQQPIKINCLRDRAYP